MGGRPSGILAEPLLRVPVHEEHGLACRLSARPAMRRSHRHDDVELALAVGGWVEHEHAGLRSRVPEGTLVVCWGALPHRVSAAAPGAAVRWLTVPLADALDWDTEGRLTGPLLGGARHVLPGRSADADLLARWAADLAGGAPAEARAARLEVRAFLERLSLAVEPVVAAPAGAGPGGRPARRVAVMAAVVARRFREPLGVAEIAAAVHLHPATATAAFKAATGTTPGAFLLRCRLAEARRLLLVGDTDVDGVARQAGFGSTSSFYACFTREVGEPPAAWRRRARQAQRAGVPLAAGVRP